MSFPGAINHVLSLLPTEFSQHGPWIQANVHLVINIMIFVKLLMPLRLYGAYLVAQTVKNLPKMQETQIQALGQDDPLEKEMETHNIILAWRISWTEEPGRLTSIGVARVRRELESKPTLSTTMVGLT